MDGSKIKAGSGKHVEIELLSRTGNNEKMAFDIVPEQSADYARGYLSEGAPLAKALAGHLEGETVAYQMDELYAVRILQIRQSQEPPLADLAEERQAKYTQAIREAEHTNAVNFASSFSGKWGDYDPDSLPKEHK
ncbi:MAG: hypothetical protein A2030_03610 [Chloroflexi bacterium RBG_19FT_COMBO_50_10]|nr:MAG: hypothetical protein A2030_03610 [Chloroflexi bacterium RBG_19FT_COMBO_50_10]